ncbi:MAG TPA: M23 family metallopeptidase [Longimicrobium sp.]|jgi:hypothetical protein
MKHIVAALLGLFSAGCCCQTVTTPNVIPGSALDRGRQYTRLFYDGDADRLWEQFSPGMRQLFGTPAGVREFAAQVRRDLGTERQVLDEQTIAWLGRDLYHRAASFTGTSGPVWIEWTMSVAGVIEGFEVKPGVPEAPTRFLNYTTRTELRLPFTGDWFVVWGGRSTFLNYHAAAADQRFAYDFLVVRDGSTFAGDAALNESYHCFGQPIVAPAAGVVRAAADGIEDNRPGVMNAREPLGNHVVLDHGNGEFSFLAHLQRGSVAVQPGREVRAGEVIGRCGNSGNSTEAHLHYHLQNTGVFGAGEGLPAPFTSYFAYAQPVDRGEPTRGQHIRPR